MTFDHMHSMGLKSGEYGGRYKSSAPAASMASITAPRREKSADRMEGAILTGMRDIFL